HTTRFANCCDMVARVPPEMFDRPHIAGLLEELTGNSAVAATAAAVLAPILSAAGITARFVHVAPRWYIDAIGNVSAQDDESAPTARSDQERARNEYRETHRLASLNAPALAAALGGVGAAIAGPESVAAAIRAAWAQLFPAVAGGKVPLRDLADHAPI